MHKRNSFPLKAYCFTPIEPFFLVYVSMYCSFFLNWLPAHFKRCCRNKRKKKNLPILSCDSLLCSLHHLYYPLLLSAWNKRLGKGQRGHPRHDLAHRSHSLFIDPAQDNSQTCKREGGAPGRLYDGSLLQNVLIKAFLTSLSHLKLKLEQD